jgi:hypothetical protein
LVDEGAQQGGNIAVTGIGGRHRLAMRNEDGLSLDTRNGKQLVSCARRRGSLLCCPFDKHHLHLGNTVEEVIRACLVGPEVSGLEKGCGEREAAVAVASQNAYGEIVG